MTNFRCPPVILCASAKIAQIRVRSCVEGPSSRASIVGDEIRDVADACELKVCAEGFWEGLEAADVRVVIRPGIAMCACPSKAFMQLHSCEYYVVD